MQQREATVKAKEMAPRVIRSISGLIVLCAVALGLVLPAGASAATYTIMVSGSPDRSDPVPLDGRTIDADNHPQGIYIFLSRNSPEDVLRAQYYLDDAWVKTENIPPFDLAGTNLDLSAAPYDLSQLTRGTHDLSATIDTVDGQSVLSADFTVVKGGQSGCDAGPFHSPDHYPPACWRPFADTSPFNQQIPANARIDPRSDEMVSRLLAAGPVNDGRAGIADTPEDYHKPAYFADSRDPVFTIEGGSTTPPYEVDGQHVRMPLEARPAGGSDHHLTIVYNGYEYGLWRAHVDLLTRTITADAGRKIPLNGDGLDGGSTAARFGNLAGRIRIQELRAGVINHALFMASNSIASSAVYPAAKSDGWRSAASGYPPMGTRFQLAMSDAQIDAMNVPDWKKAVLHALKNYGGYLGDSTSSPWTALSFESASDYTSFGLIDPFALYAKGHDLPSYFDGSIDRRVYLFDLDSGVDWARYLRVIAPCVTERTC
jgi:hypothetical protein